MQVKETREKGRNERERQKKEEKDRADTGQI